jgi:hypothetical protein
MTMTQESRPTTHRKSVSLLRTYNQEIKMGDLVRANQADRFIAAFKPELDAFAQKQSERFGRPISYEYDFSTYEITFSTTLSAVDNGADETEIIFPAFSIFLDEDTDDEDLAERVQEVLDISPVDSATRIKTVLRS